MIDRVRYILGILHLIVVPPGVLFWFIIHPWIHWWRRLGPIRTYLIVASVGIAFGALLFRFRVLLLGADFGTNWSLVVIALVLYVVVVWLESQYWRHLSIATLVGIPELSPPEQKKGGLIQEGIYAVVRHPRYLSAGVAVVAQSLFINYAGMYILIVLLIPVGYAMIVIEERELIDRFGEEYRRYQQAVPRFIPRWRKLNRQWRPTRRSR
jgi:protein-S-isoprenylcysteine O-methyltransferase Ste14